MNPEYGSNALRKTINENIAIVVADFNADITHLMSKIAKEYLGFLGARVVEVIRVPGAFEMPLAIQRLLQRKDVDGVVTLGAVIQGDTDHDSIVAGNASRKIMDLMLVHDKPVSLGIIGPKVTHAAAVARIDEYAKRASESCIKMLRKQ